MIYYVFPWGKYKGKTVEQVAMANYPDLVGLRDWSIDHPKSLSWQFIDHINQVIHALNNFVPVIGCREDSCEDPAAYLSIVINGDIFVSTNRVYCESHINYESSRNPKTQKFPFEFNILRHLPQRPKYLREETKKVLLEGAGYMGRNTPANAQAFIASLKLKSQYEPAPRPQIATPLPAKILQARLFE